MEIAGVDKSTLKKFSRRTAHIEEKAKASGVTNAKKKMVLGQDARTQNKKSVLRRAPSGMAVAAYRR